MLVMRHGYLFSSSSIVYSVSEYSSRNCLLPRVSLSLMPCAPFCCLSERKCTCFFSVSFDFWRSFFFSVLLTASFPRVRHSHCKLAITSLTGIVSVHSLSKNWFICFPPFFTSFCLVEVTSFARFTNLLCISGVYLSELTIKNKSRHI